jgi:putative oxidoreductase
MNAVTAKNVRAGGSCSGELPKFEEIAEVATPRLCTSELGGMSIEGALLQRWAPRMLSILRMVAAFLFMPNGTLKLFHYPVPPHPIPHLPPLMVLAGSLECFGGLLLLLGLFTRPVAFILSGEMATAYFKAHAPRGFWPVLNNGDLAALYCFVFLYLAVAGGGTWSIDQLWRRKWHSTAPIQDQ